MRYFVDPYKMYYEKLKDASSMSSDSTSVGDDVSSLKTSSSTLTSSVSASQWQEMGASTITTTIIPGLTTLLTKLGNDLSSTLSQALSMAADIVAKASDLKEKDEELEKKEEELATTKASEPTKYEEGTLNKTTEYTNWESKISELGTEITKLENECKELQADIDSIAAAINALEVSSDADTKVDIGSDVTDGTDTATQIAADGTFVKLNYSGSTFNVINTKHISVVDFVKYIQQYGLNQTSNQAAYGNECLGVSYAYSNRLYNNVDLPTNMDAFYSGAYTANNDKATESQDKQTILGNIYDELVAGRPCVVQVTTKAGHRHFATCVRMKDTVTSRDSIKEEDLLIIDSWDGRLETMDGSNEKDDRHLYKSSYGWFVGKLKTSSSSA